MGRSNHSSESSSYVSSESSSGIRRGGKRNRSRSPEYANGHDYPKRSPSGLPCQVCRKMNHWTVECDSVHRYPDRYPNIDVRNGCPICGKVGHRWNRCPNTKYPCESCGDLHATRECPYGYVPIEYHEFFDSTKGYPYFYCVKDKTISWVYKGNKLDNLLWHCDKCRVLLPTSVPECVLCQTDRKKKAKEIKSAPAHKADKTAEGNNSKQATASKEAADPAASQNDKNVEEKDNAKATELRGDGLTFAAISGWIDETTAYTN